jgi:hypothetical protein
LEQAEQLELLVSEQLGRLDLRVRQAQAVARLARLEQLAKGLLELQDCLVSMEQLALQVREVQLAARVLLVYRELLDSKVLLELDQAEPLAQLGNKARLAQMEPLE